MFEELQHFHFKNFTKKSFTNYKKYNRYRSTVINRHFLQNFYRKTETLIRIKTQQISHNEIYKH